MSGRPQHRLPTSRRPELCGDCNSRPGSRTDRRAEDPEGRDKAGRSPSAGLVSDMHPHSAAQPQLCFHKTEPEPHIGSHHNWRQRNIFWFLKQTNPQAQHAAGMLKTYNTGWTISSFRVIINTVLAKASPTCSAFHWSSSSGPAPERWAPVSLLKWCNHHLDLRWNCHKGHRPYSEAFAPLWCWGC